MESEFWAAITGAVVGGVLALLIQLISLRETRNQREKEDWQRKRALGYGLLLKVARMVSNFKFLDRFLESERESGTHLGIADEPWQYVRALPNPPSRVLLTDAELALLLEFAETDLFHEMFVLDETHNATIDLLDVYGKERAALTTKLPATMEGHVAYTQSTDEQEKLLAPQKAAVNSLANHLMKRSKSDAERSEESLDRLRVALASHLQIQIDAKLIR